MQFKLVLLGGMLLIIGLIAYFSVPNVHRTPVFQAESLPAQSPIIVPASGATQIAKNLTVFREGQNQLQVNLTVTSSSSEGSKILLKIFPGNDTTACLSSQKAYLVNQEVSNQTLLARIDSSGLYCFDFENLDSQNPKTVTLTASISTRFERVQIANDGGMNLAGLGLGALGFLIALLGFAKKTVIPWE